MRAPISVIIPTLNAAAGLPLTLGSLGDGLAAGLIREVILSDGGSDDAIVEIAEAAGATLLTGPPGRGGQMRRGAAAAKGDWLLFLHADSQLAAEWSASVISHLKDHPSKAGYFRLAFDQASFGARWTAAWANLRSRLFELPYGDQGLLIPRALYDEIGGVPDISLMEDVALARALRTRLIGLPATLTTSSEKYRRGGWFRRGAWNIWLLIRYLAGSDPEKLARLYRKP